MTRRPSALPMRARSARRAALAALFVFAQAGCQEPRRESGRPDPADGSEDFPPVASAAARSAHVLERAGDRCVLYHLEGDDRRLGDTVTCPRELADGERIRWARGACLRESGEPSRAVPVRCPSELVDAATSPSGS